VSDYVRNYLVPDQRLDPAVAQTEIFTAM
jgi:hypothetical protein